MVGSIDDLSLSVRDTLRVWRDRTASATNQDLQSGRTMGRRPCRRLHSRLRLHRKAGRPARQPPPTPSITSSETRELLTLPIPLSPRQSLGQLQSLLLVSIRSQPPARDVVPVKAFGFPAVSKADLKASGLPHGFVPDDADAVGCQN
jgi:hypothetical protein